jgi:peptide/nickel transport system permease protein
MPYVLINAAQAGKKVITEAVALYFLGFLPMSQGNWGRMMDRAYQYGAITNLDIFYLILWPMLVLSLLSFGLVLLSQGLDQVFNPRLRARHLQEGNEARLDPSND